MKLSTIVVGVDDQQPSGTALLQAIALAQHHRSQLILVHGSAVTDTTLYAQAEGTRGNAPWKAYLDELVARADAMLQERAQQCRDADVRVTPQLVHSFPDAAIASVARDSEADLVVVGTHGRRGPEHWLLGSVAEQVVRLAPCPVLVARPDTEPKGCPDKLVVSTDFSPTAELALAAALSLAAPEAAIELLHCWQPPASYGMALPIELSDHALDDARQRLDQLADKHEVGGRHMSTHVRASHTVDGIVDRVAQQQPDWLVIGSHGRRGLRRLILGSVTEQTIRRIQRSVLVVRGHDPGWELALPVIM